MVNVTYGVCDVADGSGEIVDSVVDCDGSNTVSGDDEMVTMET